MAHPKELLTELKQVCSSVRMDLQNWPGLSVLGKARVLQALDKFETASAEDIEMFGDVTDKQGPLTELLQTRIVHARELRSMYDSLLKAAHDMASLVQLELADPLAFKAILVVKVVPLEPEKTKTELPN